jgi:hypothetical protein
MSKAAAKPTLAIGPFIPATYDVADVAAIQALQRGDASAEQQQRALRWLIEQAAGTYEFAYYPSDRDTAFALGRGFVGQQVVKLLKLNLMSLRRLSNANPSTPAPTS